MNCACEKARKNKVMDSESQLRRQQEDQKVWLECMDIWAKIVLCYPCAEGYFPDENEKCEKYLCASSLNGMVYGTLTTILSSGACHGVEKSSTGLGFGITGLVLGTIGGLCLYAYGRKRQEPSSLVGSHSNENSTITTQPQRSYAC